MNKIIEELKKDWKEQSAFNKLMPILGGMDITFYIITPILISIIWYKLSLFGNFSDYLVYGVGLLATMFRAIKIGWMK